MDSEKKIYITERIILFTFCFIVIIPICLLLALVSIKPSFYNNKYEFDSISILSKEDLLNINDFEEVKLQTNTISHLSLVFAKFARYPYDKDKNFNNKKFLNFDIINYGIKSDDNYFVTFKNDSLKTVIIAFPGTLERPQLLDEAFGSELKNFDEKISNKILIGKYFGERTVSLLDLIFNEKLKKLIKDGYQIISTGHSLGGAMAQCFMYFAISKGKIAKENVPITITYGQPKVGNIYFAHFLDTNAFLNLRFVNKDDLVQYIPFCSGIFNHIFYFLDRLDNVKIYAHTSIEINQHNICNLPTILYIFFIIIKIIIFIVKFFLFLSPIYVLYNCLSKIYSIWSKIEPKYNKYYYYAILAGLSIVYYKFNIYNIFKKYSYLTFIIWLIVVTILSAIIIFTLIVCLIQLFYLIKYMIDYCKGLENEEIKYIKKNFNFETIFKIIYLVLASIYGAILTFINVIPHLGYQFTNKIKENYLEIKNDPVIQDTINILYDENYNLITSRNKDEKNIIKND